MSRKKTPESIPQKEVESPQNESKPRPFESLRDMIGLVSAGAGIFAALLYLAGRSFASGYFAAMNIPSYLVSFSLWEYGEVAWLPMFFYPTLIFGVGGLFWTIIYGFGDLIMPWLEGMIKIKRPTWFDLEFSKHTKRWFDLFLLSILIMSFIWFTDTTLQIVENNGRESGQIAVLEKAAQVELISSMPMPLDEDNLLPVQSSRQDYYIYKGFHLLTVNNSKYYLFKEINPSTCKPVKIYIIDTVQNLQVNLLPTESLVGRCQKSTSPQVIATSASTQPTP